jgi:hypothetical protein
MFWTHMMELLDDLDMWNLVSICLKILLILTQRRCTACAEHTIGSKTFLDAPDGTPR